MTTSEILTALKAIEDKLTRTPTAFRWTPAMSAIWPKDYRPTMTGLLAMWEAMHEAAEYGDDYYTRVGNAYSSQDASDAPRTCWNGRPLSEAPHADDGWIIWPGGKQPVSDTTVVEVKYRDGEYPPYRNGKSGTAEFYSWSDNKSQSDIIAYRVIK